MKYYIANTTIDNCPGSPRDWDNLGIIAAKHNKYDIADSGHLNVEDFFEDLPSIEKDYLYLPIYIYAHGGISLSTTPFSCPWDSGHVGYIYASKDRIKKEFEVEDITNDIIEKAYNLFTEEIKVYSQYLSGEIYQFLVYELDKEQVEDIIQYLPEDWVEKYELMNTEDRIEFSKRYFMLEDEGDIDGEVVDVVGGYYEEDIAKEEALITISNFIISEDIA